MRSTGVADPGYFTALEIPLLQGRFFTNQDRDDHANQVIISHQLAKQYFPGENPLGRHLLVSARDKAPIRDRGRGGRHALAGRPAD